MGNTGYPTDGHPENGDGTFGNDIIDVHDLLDLLANYHRDYNTHPCVY